MRIHYSLTLPIAAAALVCGRPAEASCQAPIELDVSGPRPTVQITLANGRRGTAVVDTGAMGAVVDSRYAEALGLANEGPVEPPFDQLPGANNYRSTLKGLRIGEVSVGDVAAPVVPTPLSGIAAILSPLIFSGRLVEIDFGAGELRLCDRAAGVRRLGSGTPHTDGPFALPAIPVTVDGTTLAAHIDSGSPMALAFPMRFARHFTLAAPLVRTGSARGHNGESPVYTGRIRGTVRVGPLTLTDPEARFTDVLPRPNVGMALLRRMVVTIDPLGKQSWARADQQATRPLSIPPAAGTDPPTPPPPSRTGDQG